jgi:hypothetical protein
VPTRKVLGLTVFWIPCSLLPHRRDTLDSCNIPADPVNRRPAGVIEGDDAADPEQQIDIEKIDEHVVSIGRGACSGGECN